MRPRNGPPEAVSDEPRRRRRAARRRSAGAARSARSRPGSAGRRWPRRARVTSSPPTTSDSLLASATSMPSVSATIVGPRPGRADDRVEHEVGAGLGDEPHEPLGPGQHLALGPRLGGAGGGVGVADSAIRAHAVRARLRDQRARARARRTGRRARTRSPRAGDDVERLRADRAGGAEDGELLHATHDGKGFLRGGLIHPRGRVSAPRPSGSNAANEAREPRALPAPCAAAGARLRLGLRAGRQAHQRHGPRRDLREAGVAHDRSPSAATDRGEALGIGLDHPGRAPLRSPRAPGRSAGAAISEARVLSAHQRAVACLRHRLALAEAEVGVHDVGQGGRRRTAAAASARRAGGRR